MALMELGPVQAQTDTVKGYVGMRKISLGRTEPQGHLRPLLNNEFIFQIGFLDQVRQVMSDSSSASILKASCCCSPINAQSSVACI